MLRKKWWTPPTLDSDANAGGGSHENDMSSFPVPMSLSFQDHPPPPIASSFPSLVSGDGNGSESWRAGGAWFWKISANVRPQAKCFAIPTSETFSTLFCRWLQERRRYPWPLITENTIPKAWSMTRSATNPWCTSRESIIGSTSSSVVSVATLTSVALVTEDGAPASADSTFQCVVKQRMFDSDIVAHEIASTAGSIGGDLIRLPDGTSSDVLHSALLSQLFEHGESPHFLFLLQAFVSGGRSVSLVFEQVKGHALTNFPELIQSISAAESSDASIVATECINEITLQIHAALKLAGDRYGMVFHDCCNTDNILLLDLYSPDVRGACAPFRGKCIADWQTWVYVVGGGGGDDGAGSERKIICLKKPPRFLVKVIDPEYAACDCIPMVDGTVMRTSMEQKLNGAFAHLGVGREGVAPGYDVHTTLPALGDVANDVLNMTVLPDIFDLRNTWPLNPKTCRPPAPEMVNDCTAADVLWSTAFDGWQISEDEFAALDPETTLVLYC